MVEEGDIKNKNRQCIIVLFQLYRESYQARHRTQPMVTSYCSQSNWRKSFLFTDDGCFEGL